MASYRKDDLCAKAAPPRHEVSPVRNNWKGLSNICFHPMQMDMRLIDRDLQLCVGYSAYLKSVRKSSLASSYLIVLMLMLFQSVLSTCQHTA